MLDSPGRGQTSKIRSPEPGDCHTGVLRRCAMADTCRLCRDEVYQEGLCELHYLRQKEMEKDWHLGVGH